MQFIELSLACDILAAATIETTIRAGTTFVHHGPTAEGRRFTLMNDCLARSCIAFHDGDLELAAAAVLGMTAECQTLH